MALIVVNADPDWQFTEHVRRWALDLFNSRELADFQNRVELWDARKTGIDERSYGRDMWCNWPFQLNDNRNTLLSELRQQILSVSRDAAHMVILIWILPGPDAIDEADALLNRDLLEHLAEDIGVQPPETEVGSDADDEAGYDPPPQPRTNVWRIGVFRCQATREVVAAAHKLVADRLLDTALFISMPRIVKDPDEVTFAALRALMAMIYNDRIEKIMRADDMGSGHAVGLLEVPGQVKGWSESARMRALMMAAVEGADRAATDPEIEIQQGELFKDFDKLVDDTYEQEILRTIELPSPADSDILIPGPDWSGIELGEWYPRYRDGLEQQILNTARYNRSLLAEILNKRLDDWNRERNGDLRQYRNHHERIGEALDRLSDGLLGQQGSAFDDVKQRREFAEQRRENLIAKVVQRRDDITRPQADTDVDGEDDDLAKSLELESTSTKRGPRLRLNLPNCRAYAQAARSLAQRGYELMHSPVDFWLMLGLAVLATLPVFAFAAGESTAGGVWEVRFMARPISHWAYMSGAITVIVIAWAAVCTWRGRHYRRALGDLTIAAKIWPQTTEEGLNASINYLHHAYGIGWLSLLIARLRKIEEKLSRRQKFGSLFDLVRQGKDDNLWLKEDGRDSEIVRYCNTIIPQFRMTGREGWLRVLLSGLPEADFHKEIEVDIKGVVGNIEVKNRYFATPFPVIIRRFTTGS